MIQINLPQRTSGLHAAYFGILMVICLFGPRTHGACCFIVLWFASVQQRDTSLFEFDLHARRPLHLRVVRPRSLLRLVPRWHLLLGYLRLCPFRYFDTFPLVISCIWLFVLLPAVPQWHSPACALRFVLRVPACGFLLDLAMAPN